MTFQLRDYQKDAVGRVFDELARVFSTLLVAPVGAGKTIMQAEIIQRTIKKAPAARFLCVVHTRELVIQNVQAMLRAWPAAPVGINSASLGRRDMRSQILFASIQSIYRKAGAIGHVDCLIVDECHLISRNGASMYGKLIAVLRDINPELRVVGLSGTPYRMDSGLLTDGDDALFQSVAFDIPISQLIDDGFLTRPISKATATGFDLTGVTIRGGDYIQGQLEKAVNVDAVTQAAVSEIIAFGEHRKAWLVFCAGVQHAKDVRDVFRHRGICCETVEGNTPKAERDSILRRYKEGQIQCLTNVNVLSTGFDYPGIDLVALMRPTKSASLYVQQVGRCLRLAPNKEDALVLDFAGVVRTLGPIDAIDPYRPKGNGDAPVRECPECGELMHIAKQECPDCGHAFAPPEDKPRHEKQADGDSAILSSEKIPPRQLPVTTWDKRIHHKFGSPDSVRVVYTAGIAQYPEWLAFEHGGYPAQKAGQWWNQHGGDFPIPKTANEALERWHEVKMPKTITVQPKGKFFAIVGRSFERERDVA